MSVAPSGPEAFVAEVADRLLREQPLLAEMGRIRAAHSRCVTTDCDRLRYRALWLGLALYRSPALRAQPCSGILRELALRDERLADLDQERARVAVETAFGPDDSPIEEAGSSFR